MYIIIDLIIIVEHVHCSLNYYCNVIIITINNIIILIPFHIGLSITTSQDSVAGYTRKRPRLKEMLRLLREKSSEWSEIGAAFEVSLNERRSTRNDKSLNDNDRLEYMLYTWLETSSEQSNVTWEEFIRILKEDLEYHDVVEKIEELLLKQQGILKYVINIRMY